MSPLAELAEHEAARAPLAASPPPVSAHFRGIYDACYEVVRRNLRRFGVAERNLDDAVQDVFVVVHRRLQDFEWRSSLKTWVIGIALRVASDFRKVQRRAERTDDLKQWIPDAGPMPDEQVVQMQALRRVYGILNRMPDQKRVVLALADLEQMSVPEIAEALGENINTIYSRLRSARKLFEASLARLERGQR